MGKPATKRDKIITLIAILKLLKAALLIAAGIAAFEILRPSVSNTIHNWVETISFRIENETAQKAIVSLTRVTPRRAAAIGLVAFAYAGLFAVEGVGLWLGRRWAEYLTVIATASLIPFEIYEMIKQLTPLRLTALVVNVGIVIYLIYRLRTKESRR